MWAISLGHPTTEIAHFERIGLDGFSSNSLILTKEQAFRGRERDSLLVYVYYHTLVRSPFSLLSFTIFISSFSIILFIFCVFLPLFLFSPHLPLLCTVNAFFYISCRDRFLLFCPLTAFVLVQVSFLDHSWSVSCLAITTYLCLPGHILFPDKRVLFCFLAYYGIPIRIRVDILSYCFLWHALSDSSSSFPFPPKELKREPQNRLSPSPHHQTMPSFTFDPWPTTPVLAGYKWVVLEPCACSTSMCVHSLSTVHAFTMT